MFYDIYGHGWYHFTYKGIWVMGVKRSVVTFGMQPAIIKVLAYWLVHIRGRGLGRAGMVFVP